MKKVLCILTLLCAVFTGAWAQSGGFFRLHHANPDANWYISVNAAGNGYTKSESTKTDGSDVWQFIPTGVDGQYYIFNPYSGRYIGRTGDVENDTAIPLVTSVYKAGHYSKENAQFDSYNGFYLRDNTNSNNDRNGLHSTSAVTFVRWQSQSNCGNSVWLLDDVDFSDFQAQEFPSSWNNKDGDNQTTWTDLNINSTTTILNANAPIYKDIDGFVIPSGDAKNTTYTFQWISGAKRYDAFGIELIQDGEVKYADYHYGVAGGSGNYTATINAVAPGTYTIRLWSNRQCKDGATITSTCKLTPSVAGTAGTVTQWTVNDWTDASKDALAYGLKCVYFDNPGTFRPSGYGYIQQQICSEQAGTVALLFDHESGSNRLDIQGVELLSANGNSIVSHDIHEGFTGDTDSKNTYFVNVPISKMPYIVRIWTNGTRNSKGTISVAQTYTIETGSKSLSAITTELGNTPAAIIVKSGATFDIDAAYEMSKVSFEDGSAAIISYASADLSAIRGNVDVTINVNEYSFVNSKRSQATGKLTISSGKKLKVGSGQAHTGSVSSFTSLLIQGTLWYQNKSDILHNVTLDGGTIHSEDMETPGSNASGFNFSNALVFEGVTTVRNTVYFTSRWNAQYDIKKLDGNGTVRICGNGTSSNESVEDTYYAIRNAEDFTGNFNFTNTKAIVSPLAGIGLVNNAKVKSATLSNITISGNTRIEAAGNLTINGPVANSLSNNQHGYAFVGNGSGATINLGGTINLTQVNGVTNPNDKIGYNSGMTINILTGADVLAGGVYNSTTLANNANVNIASNATLAVKDKTLTPSLTNNGTIKLLDLNTTRYTATTVSGDAFNVEVSNDLLSNMSAESYNVVTGVTTSNVTAYTLNGESEIIIGEEHFRVMYDESAQKVVLTKQQTVDYTITYRTENNHSWQINGTGILNSTLNIDNFDDVDFYSNFAFDGTPVLTADTHDFTINCTEDFPFVVGRLCRIQSVGTDGKNKDYYAGEKNGSWNAWVNFTYDGVTPPTMAANSNLWYFSIVEGTPDIFTVRNFTNNKYITLSPTTGNTGLYDTPQGSVDNPSTTSSYFRLRKNANTTNTKPVEDGMFSLQHIGALGACVSLHNNAQQIGYWAGDNAESPSNGDNILRVLPIESFTTTLNGIQDDGYYGTIYSDLNIMVPTNMTAYYAQADGSSLHLEVAGNSTDIIPAGAYILHKSDQGLTEGDKITTAISMSEPTTPDFTNVLTGTLEEGKTFASELRYALSGKNGIGFYKYSPNTYPVAKAVYIPAEPTLVTAFYFDFGNGEQTTGIEQMIEQISELNNQNATILDLQGRRIEKAQKGMNIINGRKVLR